MVSISSEWTETERLSVIRSMAVLIDEALNCSAVPRDDIRTYSMWIDVVSTASVDVLERERKSILGVLK